MAFDRKRYIYALYIFELQMMHENYLLQLFISENISVCMSQVDFLFINYNTSSWDYPTCVFNPGQELLLKTSFLAPHYIFSETSITVQ